MLVFWFSFLCDTHWTRHLTQALCRLGKCPPLSYSPRPRPCAGWAMPPLSDIRRSRGLLRKKIRVSAVCMSVCICVVIHVSMWRPEVDIGHLS